MNQRDMIAAELHAAASYRREAKRRRAGSTLRELLEKWADASESRAETLRSGPLFEKEEAA